MTQSQPCPVAIVTGASRGFGKAVTAVLLDRGWAVIGDARRASELETTARELNATRLIALPGDVTDASHRNALVAAAVDAGPLRLLVNNASRLGPSPQPELADYPPSELWAVYQTNVFAPLALIQAALPVLTENAGVIINLTSDAAVEPYAGWGGYGASKAALEQVSRVLAVERPDLRVLVVDPGDMRTEMHQDAFPGEDISDRPEPGVSVPGLLALIEGDAPSGRYEVRAVVAAAGRP